MGAMSIPKDNPKSNKDIGSSGDELKNYTCRYCGSPATFPFTDVCSNHRSHFSTPVCDLSKHVMILPKRRFNRLQKPKR